VAVGGAKSKRLRTSSIVSERLLPARDRDDCAFGVAACTAIDAHQVEPFVGQHVTLTVWSVFEKLIATADAEVCVMPAVGLRVERRPDIAQERRDRAG